MREGLTRNAAPKPMNKKPLATTGNVDPDAWRELPIATTNEAASVFIVDMCDA